MNISQQLTADERARGECYRLLAACFYQPQKEVFMEERLLENLTAVLRQAYPEASVFSEKMGQAISACSNEELLVEYARLFVGPYELRAAPYGSVYLDDGRKVMGDSTMEVLKVYRDEGLLIDENFRELPDHIAVELEFMYYLIFREIEAVESHDNEKAAHFLGVQRWFHSRFLSPWVEPFCDKITKGTGNEFYAALAGCLSIFVLKTTVSEDLRAFVGGTHTPL